MKTKHTQGEWKAEGSDRSHRITIKQGKKLIATISNCEDDWSNAKLIAASPELLEVLITTLGVIPYGNEAIVSLIESTIKKATK